MATVSVSFCSVVGSKFEKQVLARVKTNLSLNVQFSTLRLHLSRPVVVAIKFGGLYKICNISKLAYDSDLKLDAFLRVFLIVYGTVRSIPKGEDDKIITDEAVQTCLLRFFQALSDCEPQNATGQDSEEHDVTANRSSAETICNDGLSIMDRKFGFVVERRRSLLPEGGCGVFVTKGSAPAHCIVSMYSGMIYQPYEPILLASIGNPFVFRCLDGIMLDGNDKKLSKLLYRSCCHRDRTGYYLQGDMSWLTEFPCNPLAVGQYVNNQSKRYPANVAYQEFNIPADFPLHLRRFIPNIHYSTTNSHSEALQRLTRVVVLVSTRPIEEGEELYSSYFTLVH